MENLYVTSVREQHKIPKLEEMKTLVLQKENKKIRLVKVDDIYSFYTIGELRLYRGSKEKANTIITKLISKGFVDTEVIGRL